ncbi:MAG: Sirohydrochlorin ferrochelatase [Verrucomicrobiae bacterium]|nr:Sirohydrochlorin ferrochelatase [Verrucomicrobiae bacterium]
MQRKTGVIIFTHGSRLKAGNETMLKLVEQIRRQFDHAPIEPCFMELGKPLIPVALKKLVNQGCTHIFGYALFLVPGSHLQEDIPFIFEQTLKKYPGVTWEISPPMMNDPLLVEFVAKHVEQALAKS